jgi:hypothetical protein
MVIFYLFFVVIYKIGLQHAEIVMVLSTYVTDLSENEKLEAPRGL